MTNDPAALERRARALLRPEVLRLLCGRLRPQVTLRANVKAWRRVLLLPRMLRDLLSGLTSGFAHAMALAGAATVADLEGVVAPVLPPGTAGAVPHDGAAPQRWPGPHPRNSVGV